MGIVCRSGVQMIYVVISVRCIALFQLKPVQKREDSFLNCVFARMPDRKPALQTQLFSLCFCVKFRSEYLGVGKSILDKFRVRLVLFSHAITCRLPALYCNVIVCVVRNDEIVGCATSCCLHLHASSAVVGPTWQWSKSAAQRRESESVLEAKRVCVPLRL